MSKTGKFSTHHVPDEGIWYVPGEMVRVDESTSRIQIIKDLNGEYDEQLRAFGLSTIERAQTLIYEGRLRLATILLASFGRAIAEVGAVIIVGGNINHVTRTMTTAIALETSRGELGIALALGIILLTLALGINALVAVLRPMREYSSKPVSMAAIRLACWRNCPRLTVAAPRSPAAIAVSASPAK